MTLLGVACRVVCLFYPVNSANAVLKVSFGLHQGSADFDFNVCWLPQLWGVEVDLALCSKIMPLYLGNVSQRSDGKSVKCSPAAEKQKREIIVQCEASYNDSSVDRLKL